MVPGRGVAAVLGTAARHELRDRLVRRFGRNLTTLGPLFTGAAVAALPQPAGHAAPGRGGPARPGQQRLPPAITAGSATSGLGRALPVSGQAAPRPVRVAGAHEPVRRRVGRVVEVDADPAGDPRPLDDEGERVGVAAEQVAALLRRRAA